MTLLMSDMVLFQLKREADKKRTAEIQRISDSYQVQLEKLKQGFQKQLIQLVSQRALLFHVIIITVYTGEREKKKTLISLPTV